MGALEQDTSVTAEPTFLGPWGGGVGRREPRLPETFISLALGWAWCVFQDVLLASVALGAVSHSPAQSSETTDLGSRRSVCGAGAIPTAHSTPKIIPAEDWSPGGSICHAPAPFSLRGPARSWASPHFCAAVQPSSSPACGF